jgi:hypothetical protein
MLWLGKGDELNYVDGYMKAALELATAVIKEGMYGGPDNRAAQAYYGLAVPPRPPFASGT